MSGSLLWMLLREVGSNEVDEVSYRLRIYTRKVGSNEVDEFCFYCGYSREYDNKPRHKTPPSIIKEWTRFLCTTLVAEPRFAAINQLEVCVHESCSLRRLPILIYPCYDIVESFLGDYLRLRRFHVEGFLTRHGSISAPTFVSNILDSVKSRACISPVPMVVARQASRLLCRNPV